MAKYAQTTACFVLPNFQGAKDFLRAPHHADERKKEVFGEDREFEGKIRKNSDLVDKLSRLEQRNKKLQEMEEASMNPLLATKNKRKNRQKKTKKVYIENVENEPQKKKLEKKKERKHSCIDDKTNEKYPSMKDQMKNILNFF